MFFENSLPIWEHFNCSYIMAQTVQQLPNLSDAEHGVVSYRRQGMNSKHTRWRNGGGVGW